MLRNIYGRVVYYWCLLLIKVNFMRLNAKSLLDLCTFAFVNRMEDMHWQEIT